MPLERGKNSVDEDSADSLDAQLFFGVGTEALGSPWRTPYHIDQATADAGQLLDA